MPITYQKTKLNILSVFFKNIIAYLLHNNIIKKKNCHFLVATEKKWKYKKKRTLKKHILFLYNQLLYNKIVF